MKIKHLISAISALLILGILTACTPPAADIETTDTKAEVTTEAQTEGITYVKKAKEDITVNFLGDSITLGYALTNQTKDRFSAVICERYGVIEQNNGICGTLVACAGQNRTDLLDYVDRIELIKDSDLAIIFGGTNDYFWSDKPIYAPEDDTDKEPYEYFADALDVICQYVIENRNPGTTLLVTPYPHKGTGNYEGCGHYKISNEHETSEKNYNGQVMADYVQAIKDAGEKYGIDVLDLHTDSEFDYTTMTIDGCHPNAEGHEWLADKIGAWVKEKISLIAE